ncbi:MAG TPA: hypothetical protein VLJ37_09565 [bacterium]|nr:hypothetical protein [bacterium]
MIVLDIILYFLIGLTVSILIAWMWTETVTFFSCLRERSLTHQGGHWLIAAAFLATTALAGCGGGSQEGTGTIVSPKAPSGSGATKADGESILPGGGAGGGMSATGTVTGGSPPALGEGPESGGSDGGDTTGGGAAQGTSPALIMQVVNTILN